MYIKTNKMERDYTVIDLETTGLNEKTENIIQVGAVKYRGNQKVKEYMEYVNPGREIPERITELTGITNEDVKESCEIGDVLVRLVEFIGKDIVVAHNAQFDMKFFLWNLKQTGVSYPKYIVIDTLQLSRKYVKGTKNHKLPTLKKFLRVEALSHDALDDCIVAGELYKYCYKEYTEKEGILNALELKL